MSVADHAARFDPQLALDLASSRPKLAPPRAPLHRPTHADLVAAARANEFVQAFIAENLMTWTDARIERNPPCFLVYEHGEVIGSVAEIPAMIRHAEKRRGLGSLLGIRPLEPGEEVLPYNIGVRWAPTHPRRYRYEQRMALKSRLARRDRSAVQSAMRKKKRDFLAWASTKPGLAGRLADATGLTLDAFWRAVRGRV